MKLYNHFGRVLGSILLVAGIHSAFAKEAVNSDDADGSAVVESEDTEESVEAASANSDYEMVEVAPDDSIRYYQNLIDKLKPVADSRRKTGGVVMITGAGLTIAGMALLVLSDNSSDSDCESDMFGSQTCTSSGDEEEELDSRDIAGLALAVGGTVTFFTGLFIRKSGNHKLRTIKRYETKKQHWKELAEHAVSWRVQPIVDPRHGRGGMELALGF